MTGKCVTLSALLVFATAPALADCAQEISAVEELYQQTQLESVDEVAGSEHSGAAAAAGQTGGGPEAASSEHQRQVLESDPAAPPQEQFAMHIDEARRLAGTGDEAACMEQVAEAEKLIGMD